MIDGVGTNRLPRIRLAELLATLSLVTDLARGHPYEEAMRACLLAARMAARLGLPEDGQVAVYYTSLLRSVGCTATSHEYAALFGDDVGLRRRGDMTDSARPVQAMGLLLATAPRRGPAVARARQLATAARDARSVVAEGSRADCEVASSMARRFALPPGVAGSLEDIWERWDGKGFPARKRAESIALPARIAMVATVAVMFELEHGPEVGARTVRDWSGRALDPGIADALLREPGALLEAALADDPLAAVLAAEPGRPRFVGDHELDEVARGFAEVVDLKSPYLHGHSLGVGELAAGAALLAGLAEAEQRTMRRAGRLHDLGRAGVSTRTWEKPGPLSMAEVEQVRLHAYHTERILSPAPALAPLARLAGLHHERLDGSGYHRGAVASALDRPARLLAAADVYQALIEPRPHRPARSPEQAATTLATLPLDPDAVEAVLEAAGHARRSRRRTHPAGLTEREVEVLRLLVQGLSERRIAALLVVSPSTVHTHVSHIYEKAEVSTRASAAVFAMEHDLVRPLS